MCIYYIEGRNIIIFLQFISDFSWENILFWQTENMAIKSNQILPKKMSNVFERKLSAKMKCWHYMNTSCENRPQRGMSLDFFSWILVLKPQKKTRSENWLDFDVWCGAYFVFSEEIWNIYILQHKQTGQCKQNKDFAREIELFYYMKLFCCKHKIKEHEHENWNYMSHESKISWKW